MGTGKKAGEQRGQGGIIEQVSPKSPLSTLSLLHPQCPMPHNLNILYIWIWKNCPLQLKIKMRAVDKTLIST
jgi:hypothetical protein